MVDKDVVGSVDVLEVVDGVDDDCVVELRDVVGKDVERVVSIVEVVVGTFDEGVIGLDAVE